MLARMMLATLITCGAAHAQDASLRYAVFADCPTAMAISVAAWKAVQCQPQIGPDGTTKTGCDPAQVTKTNYQVIGLSDLTRCAVVIHLGDYYQGEQIGPLANGKTYRLTAGQIASLQTRAQIGTLLPDILPVALAGSRLTATGKTTAVQTALNANPTLKAQYTTLTSGPIDLYPGNLVWTVMNGLVVAGALTQADVQAITATQAVTPGGA